MRMIDKITAIIRKNTSTEAEITGETDMRKDLSLDSLDVLMIMNEIEETYNVTLEQDTYKQVKTPNEIISLLREKYGIDEV